MSEFIVQGRERLLDSYVFNVDRVTVLHGNGAFTRDVVQHPGAVAIVAVDSDGQVAMLRQFRAPVGAAHLEIPAGTCDVAHEVPLETARRELIEETGASGGEWSLLSKFWNSPGWTNQVTWVYLANGVQHGESKPEGPEESSAEVLWLSRSQIVDLLETEEVFDGTATIGLMKWLNTTV